MTEIGRLYGGLYAAVGDMGGLSHFTAMAGTLYRSQETRLMVIGRATNGWKRLDTSSAAAFSREAEAADLRAFPGCPALEGTCAPRATCSTA